RRSSPRTRRGSARQSARSRAADPRSRTTTWASSSPPLIHRGGENSDLVPGENLTTTGFPLTTIAVRLEREPAVVVGDVVLVVHGATVVQTGRTLRRVASRARLGTPVGPPLPLDRLARANLRIRQC